MKFRMKKDPDFSFNGTYHVFDESGRQVARVFFAQDSRYWIDLDVFEAYRGPNVMAGYLGDSKEEMFERLAKRVAPKQNPSSAGLDKGLKLYLDFHKNEPRRVGQFDRLHIPATMVRLGEGKHVLYRSDKRDPDTGAQPRKPIDYIHEHEGGVGCFKAGKTHAVPAWIRSAPGLVKLGACLGFAYDDGDGEVEVEARAPLPVLYAIPSGKALLVIEGGHKVVAMMWGGGLDVRPEGIVG